MHFDTCSTITKDAMFDRILKANVNMLIFTLYNKMFQKPANVPPVYGISAILFILFQLFASISYLFAKHV